MGCVHFARLIDIPQSVRKHRISSHITEGKKKTKQYFKLFSSIIKASVSI